LVIVENVGASRHAPLSPLGATGEFQVRRFTVANIGISVIIEAGQDRRVLLLHGNSSCNAVWARQIPVLRQQGYAILAPDLPGHGQSDNSRTPEATYSFPGYAAIIGGLLDALNWPAVDVVGWSLGGHIGLELLASDVRIRSLLIVGTPPARPSTEALEQAFHSSDQMQLAGKPEFSDADALAYGTAMMGGDEQLTPQLMTNIRRTDGNARKFMVANALRGVGADQREAVRTIDKPLCVIHGAEEPFVRLDYLRSLTYRALWQNRIFVIAGAGHAPHWQCAPAFNRILTDFLRSMRTH
jgi:pimeloyl-ACP methyl ester carboxylesterase